MKHLKRIDENFDSTEDQDKDTLFAMGLADLDWDDRYQRAVNEVMDDPEIMKAISLIRTKVEESVDKWIPWDEFDQENNALYSELGEQSVNEIGVFEFFMFG